MIEKYLLDAHHVGCLTRDIEGSKKIYSSTLGFGKSSETFTIRDQNVKVCFIEIREGFYVELVEPVGNNPALNKLLKAGNAFYHVAYLADNADEVLAKMLEDGFYLVNSFFSEAFQGKKCMFLYTPEMQLIELIQK